MNSAATMLSPAQSSLRQSNAVQLLLLLSVHSTMNETLRIFEQNDTEKLYSLALILWKKGVFSQYLTNQQLTVLEQILVHSNDPKTVFQLFISSKLSLKFIEPVRSEDQNLQAPPSPKSQNISPTFEKKEISSINNASTTTTNSAANTTTTATTGSQIDDKSQSKDQEAYNEHAIMIEQTIANGVESARSLALKVRYILWDKAILVHFNENIDDSDYNLLDQDEEDTKTNDESKTVEASTVRKTDDNYDDDYDEEEDDDNEETKEEGDNASEKTDDSNGTKTHEFDSEGNIILEVPIVQSDSNQLENRSIVDNFNRIYHNFENDKETIIKRRKLEENDKLLEEHDDQADLADLFSMNLGAANLSLKHLLRSIDENKEKLNLQDNELRQLIMDVRKNRSKWASDDKIGQEELYEACEKVVMELRGYTEHSTAFLNKVSKREAPNYSQVIKKPMDLNTILKKLKSFQYKSKTEFVDDVLLIWKNCLTYNSDPRHFLRAHAIAMQKKSLSLIPLIPDITIRDRSEVEAEVEAEVGTPRPSGKTTSKKGKKRTRNGEVKEETAGTGSSTAAGIENGSAALDSNIDNVVDTLDTTPTVAPSNNPTDLQLSTINGTAVDDTNASAKAVGDATEIEEDDNGETNDYLDTEDNDKDDLEMTTWKNVTSKVRADLCIKRSELFKDNELNKDSVAILSAPKRMKDLEVSFSKQDETSRRLHVFKPLTKIDEDPYLLEYDVTGVIPPLDYKGQDEEAIESNESNLVDEVLAQGGLSESSPFAFKEGGLNRIVNENIKEMQEIRKLCFKISLIRQMQQQQFLHHSQLKGPEIEEIDDSIDLDPVSRLPNHDQMNKDLIYSVLKKRVSKIAMLSGFETTELCAVDTLTQVTGDYMDNLIKTIKTHLETPSINKDKKEKSILHLSLLQNGIKKPDDLFIYVHENVLRQHTKLKDLKGKLSNFLKNLLRPAFDLNNEKTFDDNSDQFLSGDFSNEIGEDFFGFKELGLDKEFGMVGNSIPLHLLHSRFSESSQVDIVKDNKREEFEKAPYKRLRDDEISQEIGLIQPFLRNTVLEKTKLFHSKQFKSKREIQEYLSTATGVILMDDEDYPKKQSRPKLPPTGKITPAKKKITNITFFLPENDDAAVAGASSGKINQNPVKREDDVTDDRRMSNMFDNDDDNTLTSQLSMIPEINGIEV